MKKLFISFAIAVMAFVSCSKETLNESAIETKSYSLTAVAPGDDATKTSLQKNEESGNWNVLWSEGDALKVKVSGDGTSSSHYAVYTLESGAGTGNAVFKGTVEAPDQVFAFYPSSLTTTINSYGMFFNIPNEQTYSATGEVANSSLPMWAKGDKTNLKFNHICSIIRIPVWINQSGVELSKVNLKSNKNISGGWYFKTSFDSPLPASPRQLIDLNCGNLELSTSESEPTILNFVAAVGSGSWGDLEITFYFSDGSTFTKSTSSLSAATKGKVYKLATLELSRVASDMQIQIDGGSWENWDGISDIATPESSVAVKGTDTKLTRESMRIIMSKVKSGSATIDLDFSSIRCDFSTIETDDDLFADNKKIGNLKLPAGITTLNTSSFSATSVAKVTLPVSVTNVAYYVFDSSPSGYFDVDTSHPTYCAIAGQLYKKNSGTPQTYTLVQVASGTSGVFSVAENTTAILKNAFRWCNRITAIAIPVSVNTLEYNSTYLMTSVKNITLLCETPPTLGLSTGSHWQNNQYFPGWNLKAGTTKTITVPAGCLEAYTGTEGNRTDWWKQYHDIAGFEFTE